MSNSAEMLLDYGIMFLIVFGSVLVPLFVSRKSKPRKSFLSMIMKYVIARKFAASIMIFCLIIIGCLGLILLKCQEINRNASLSNFKKAPSLG